MYYGQLKNGCFLQTLVWEINGTDKNNKNSFFLLISILYINIKVFSIAVITETIHNG